MAVARRKFLGFFHLIAIFARRSMKKHEKTPFPAVKKGKTLTQQSIFFAGKPRFCVGLTGGIGSGKSAAAAHFARLGACVIDADDVAHALTAAGGDAMPEILAHFGAEFADENGALDRRKMRELVFKHPAARAELEAILHPKILQAAKYAAETRAGDYVIFVVPLLFEQGGFLPWIARSLLIDCPETLQKSRVIARNQHAPELVDAMIAAQMPREKRQAYANDMIDNASSLDALQTKVEAQHAQYLALARQFSAENG